MDDMTLPSEEELAQLSRDLGCRYPDSYWQFLRSPKTATLRALTKEFPDGWFVRSIADIREFVDAEMAGDELALFFAQGSRLKMADISPYGAPQGLVFYGFDLRYDLYPDLKESPVVIFSLHAVVGGWRSFPEFIEYIGEKAGWSLGKYGFFVRLDTGKKDLDGMP